MSNFETFSQESSELKEIDWVKQQIKAELHSLQQDAFYRKDSDTGKVDYNLTTVKDYLQTLQGKDRATLTSKNSSARVMAVQIALESKGYDVGKIDGIFGMHTRQQVRAFQEANQLTVDGLPGAETIAKLVELLGSEVEPTDEARKNDQKHPPETNEKPRSPSLESPPQLNLSDLGEWKEGVFIFKKGVEKKDNQGTYIELAGKKFYDNANNGLGYVVSDGKWLYFGDFKNDTRTGKGVRTRANGNRYEGDFKDNMENGKGIYTRANGNRYEGDFKDGKIHGKGVLTRANGNRYEGDFKDRELQVDKGRPNFITQTDMRPDEDRSQERGNVRLDQEGDRYTLKSRGQSITYTKVKNGWQFETKVPEGEVGVLILPNKLDDAQVKKAANLINKMMHMLNQNKQEYGVGEFEVDGTRALQIDYPDKVWDVDVISSARVESIFGIYPYHLAKWLNLYRLNVIKS